MFHVSSVCSLTLPYFYGLLVVFFFTISFLCYIKLQEYDWMNTEAIKILLYFNWYYNLVIGILS